MEFDIVEATVGDAKNILDYLKIVGGETNNLSIDANGLKITLDDEIELLSKYTKEQKGVFLLAKLQDEIIGCCTAFPMDNRRHSHVLDFAISVKKKYWNQGIANSLMDKVIYLAKDRNFHKLMLYVRVDNEVAISLYKKKGFVVEGEIKDNMKIKDEFFDDYYMAKIL